MPSPHPSPSTIHFSIEGSWRPIRAELDAALAPADALERMELRLASGHYTVSFAGEVHDRGDYEVDASPALARLTLTGRHGENKGRVIPAIFQRAGNLLRVCYGLDRVTPAAFVTALDSHRYLVTYRRIAAET